MHVTAGKHVVSVGPLAVSAQTTALDMLQSVTGLSGCLSVTCGRTPISPSALLTTIHPDAPQELLRLEFVVDSSLQPCSAIGCSRLFVATSSRRACPRCLGDGLPVESARVLYCSDSGGSSGLQDIFWLFEAQVNKDATPTTCDSFALPSLSRTVPC